MTVVTIVILVAVLEKVEVLEVMGDSSGDTVFVGCMMTLVVAMTTVNGGGCSRFGNDITSSGNGIGRSC